MLGELDASELDMFKFCAFHEEWCVYGGSELVDVWKHRKKTIDTKRIGKTARKIQVFFDDLIGRVGGYYV